LHRRRRTSIIASLLLAAACITGLPPAAAVAAASPGGLDVYTATLDTAQWQTLRTAGVDAGELGRPPGPGRTATVRTILGRDQAQRLIAAGVPLTVAPSTTRMRARAAAAPTVFRPYGGPGGIREELAATAARFPRLAQLKTIGTTVRGAPIQAVKVTANARTVPDGRRPAVLYLGGQHAREWITPEMTRRLLHHVLDGYGTDATTTRLLDTTELWFLPVANPDGYDMTFTSDEYRYWRKNMRDDGDGVWSPADGVDLNRNFAEKWGYDNEGSSPDPATEVYRGPRPNSEPETRAMDALFRRVGFEFLVNYHSAAELILWGSGWQVETVNPDDQISMALAGDDAHPAVPGYDPDISAELYVTNGDTNLYAQARYGTIAFAPEMSTCETASASVPDDAWLPEDCRTPFDFPDDERLIQAEFAKNIPFALSLARSAKDPANPVSAVGFQTRDLLADTFPESFGATQPVAVTAKRSLGAVTLRYRINNGRVRTAPVTEWRGGERYGGTADRYFTELRGTVRGQRPKDRVTVWFTAAGGARSEPFTYTVADRTGGDVLVLAAEDVTGIAPAATDGATSARYADDHVAALRRAGHTADVYDMDTHGRRAPHPLGVLSHYRAVVWETGDDIVPRDPGQPEWTTTRAEFATQLAVRDYLNEGGKLLYSGQYAGYPATQYVVYSTPEAPAECGIGDDWNCQPLSDDFRQYWLGAGTYAADAGSSTLAGTAGPLAGFTAPAGPQQHTAAFLSTSSELPPDEFPQFTSTVPMVWAPDGTGPYDPADGDWYVSSGQADSSFKRLTRTVDLTTATDAHLRFRTSFDTDAGGDFLFVEVRETGTDTWTTLPDTGGLTSTDTGWGCLYGRVDPHPFMAHYWSEDCAPHGSTGDWNAASGSSGGWKDFDADLSAYRGRQVEVSISYMSGHYTQGFGVFLDDVRVDVDGTDITRTSFESDLGGWTVPGPPEGSPPAAGDWTRSRRAYDFGAATATADTLYLGFGLERLAPADRDDLVARAMRHLLPD
jgi:hypothetical protein